MPIGLSDVQLLNLAERDLARLQAARKIAKHSLLWGLGEHLYDEYQKVKQFLTNLREQKQQAEEEAADLASIEKDGQKSKRRALVRLLITLAVLIVLAVSGYFGVKYLALSGLVLVVVAVAVALFWLVVLVRSLWRCMRSWFLAEHHMYWVRQGRIEVLDQAIIFEDAQMRRFNLWGAETPRVMRRARIRG